MIILDTNVLSEAKTSLTILTAAGWDGHSATYKTSIFTSCSPVSLSFSLSILDNGRAACASLSCSCAEPNEVRAPTPEDR
jgi:hypothetical protein